MLCLRTACFVLAIGVGVPGLGAVGVGAAVVDPGYRLPTGEMRPLSELVPEPRVLVVPVFLSCASVCGMGADRLVAGAREDGGRRLPNVVFLSFDPEDNGADAAAFAAKHRLPAGWHVALGGAGLGAFLDQIGFRYTTLGKRAFDHPSLGVVLVRTPEGWLFESALNPLEAATWPSPGGRTAWELRVARYLPFIMVVSLLGAFLGLLSFVYLGWRRGGAARMAANERPQAAIPRERRSEPTARELGAVGPSGAWRRGGAARMAANPGKPLTAHGCIDNTSR